MDLIISDFKIYLQFQRHFFIVNKMGLPEKNERNDLIRQPVNELWRLFKSGSEVAFEKIYDLYFDLLFHYGLKISNDHDLIKDAIHELFIDLWQKRERLGNPDSVKNYLLKSLRRRIYKKKAAKSHIYNNDLLSNYQFLIEHSPEFKLINIQGRQDRDKKIKKVIKMLPQRQQEVIYLKFYAEMSYQQIADTMNISIPALYNLLSKAIKKLRSQISIKEVLISVSALIILFFIGLF